MQWKPETTINFPRSELSCKCGHCGASCGMQQEFMEKLQALRYLCGPLTITSGFRCGQHPTEERKVKPGSHAQGTAADIAVTTAERRFEILQAAFALGFSGIAYGKSFVHVDTGHKHQKRPATWSY